MNRREFLKVLSGAGLAMPTLLGSSACVAPLGRNNSDTGLSHGYLTSEVSSNGALVWLRADSGSRVALRYGKNLSLRADQVTAEYSVDPSSDDTAIIPLDGLESGSRYHYRAEVAGKTPGPVASFVTAPEPDDQGKVTFCFSGDTRETYQPFTVMDAIRAQRPDFFLHLGDTIYADLNGAAQRLEEFWAKYRRNRDDYATQRCFAETSVYAVWDDHEVANDYSPLHPLAPIGRKAFLDYWPIRRPASEPERIFRSVQWGASVELFLLDTRQYRNPNRSSMLGRTQKEWFFDALAKSSATFKFIGTSVPMAGGGGDRWDGYPKEREEILRFIMQKKLRGVSFISADMHCASITRVPGSGGLIDITAGPLGAPLNRITNSANRRYEFFLAENFNFAKVTVDLKAHPAEARVEFIDQDNRVFHRRKISAG